MADESPRPDAPLVAQLQSTLAQLEQVVSQLATTSDPPALPPETVDRLRQTLTTLQRTQSPPVSAPRRSPSRSQPAKPSPLRFLSLIATGLLGILVGVILWVGIPPLQVPPLWDQVVSYLPALPQVSPSPLSSPKDEELAPTVENAPPEPPPEPDTLPPILEAPAPPTAIALEPLPEAPLTPEQSLLAVIQQELVDFKGLYPPQLIQRIEPNFAASRLTLTIGPRWIELSAKQQQTVLDTLWQRAQKLSFQSLRLYDSGGQLIARSPVVGDKMVVLQAVTPVP